MKIVSRAHLKPHGQLVWYYVMRYYNFVLYENQIFAYRDIILRGSILAFCFAFDRYKRVRAVCGIP